MTQEQPLPIASKGDLWQDIIDRYSRPNPPGNVDDNSKIVEAMKARRLLGIERYGQPVQPHNGRDVLRDLREELLDAMVYIEQAKAEYKLFSGEADRFQYQLMEILDICFRNDGVNFR